MAGVDPFFFEDGPEVLGETPQDILVRQPAVAVFSPVFAPGVAYEEGAGGFVSAKRALKLKLNGHSFNRHLREEGYLQQFLKNNTYILNWPVSIHSFLRTDQKSSASPRETYSYGSQPEPFSGQENVKELTIRGMCILFIGLLVFS